MLILALTLKDGDAIWYKPSECSPEEFEGIVAGRASAIGPDANVIVVPLRDMSERYANAHHPDTMRRTVAAAYVGRIRRRAI